jgi:Nucleotidyltransferase of unknown function (DUF6036)
MPRSENPPIPEPWGRFLRALDSLLTEAIDLHCLGGFAVTMQYGLSRTTADIDVLAATPAGRLSELQHLAGEGSDLHRRFGVYLQSVRTVMYPENYEARLIRMWPDQPFEHLRLFALEAHDLALTKLERNSDVDREDVQALARAGFINEAALRERYETEYRPNLASGERKHDLTMGLWVEMCWPKESKP